jgi:hypothetical protein
MANSPNHHHHKGRRAIPLLTMRAAGKLPS